MLIRNKDKTGISGTGHVAEGAQFQDGTCVLRWVGERQSTVIWASVQDVEAIHGHGGDTVIEWVD